MTLLTCAQKNRSSQLWQRYHRAALRRHPVASKHAAPSSAAVLAQSLSSSSSVSAVSVDKSSLPIEKTDNNNTNTTASLVAAASVAAGDVASPWRALFLAFFAMLQPEPVKELILDDLSVDSVPPHVSAVVDASTLFWRYDMDSYAANNHNEDRSQYILDTLPENHEKQNENENTSVFFCGCYDGHGGEQAVEFVQRHLYNNIKLRLAESDTVADAIVNGFQDTDAAFHRQSLLHFENGSWSACAVGACAVIALVIDTKLYIASCGDCRAILAFRTRNGSLAVEQITIDHSANDEREQERLRVLYPEDPDIVREVGAQSFYVKGRLQPTRSLGDTYMKVARVNRAPMPRGLRVKGSFQRPYITAIPDVFELDLGDRQPEFLVLGSDGLFGEMTNEEIAQRVDTLREQGVENVSEALRGSVLERVATYYGFSTDELAQIEPGERRNYHDDITIDVVHFTPPLWAVEAGTDAALVA